ncbi:multicopper oxidase domain-containing protein, partial [Roseibium sp.]
MITLNRRQFLATSAAFSGLSASTGFAGTPFATLTAQQSDVQLLPGNYGKTSLWCFDGGSPGPEIRVAQGGRVQRRLVNRFSQGTSTHWHGIRIDNAMDGVSGLTQDVVQPEETFDYDFTVPDAGTYWY